MNYETKIQDNKGQELTLKNRNRLEITGVKKIESLNSLEFIVNTTLGILFVKGENLEMQHLDIDKGNLWITGNIYLLEYAEEKEKQKEKSSFFSKVFK